MAKSWISHETLNSLASLIESTEGRYTCCQQPFLIDKVINQNGSCFVTFACTEIISTLVCIGCDELHADGMFKVVPSNPKSKQLFILHLIVQNHVSNLINYILILSKVTYNNLINLLFNEFLLSTF